MKSRWVIKKNVNETQWQSQTSNVYRGIIYFILYIIEMWGWEIIENKEAVTPDKEATNTITSASKEDVALVVEKNQSLAFSKEFLAAKKAVQENKELVDKSNALVKGIIDNKNTFKDIVNFLSFYTTTPHNWTSITILNAPELKSNGRDNITSNNIIDTNDAQKKEIVQSFLSIPKEILTLQVQEFNNKKNEANQISSEELTTLIDKSQEHQWYQNKIQKNNSTIEGSRGDKEAPIEGNVDLASYKETQKIGKLYELPEDEQASITHQLDNIKSTYKSYTISQINLEWDADATPVTPVGKKLIKEQFTKHLNLLKEKWFNVSWLPNNYEDFGNRLVENKKIEEKDKTNTDIVSNWWFAFTRAIMQISRMNEEQMKDVSSSGLKLDINISKKRWDEETRGGIKFNGSGTKVNENGDERFSIAGQEASEVLLETGLKVAVKVWDQIKIFRFQKQDAMKSDGTTNNVALFAKMVDEWHYGTHGNEKNTLDKMENVSTKYSRADFWWPMFFINIPDAKNVSPENTGTIEKINTSDIKNSENIPSVNELLKLYTSLNWSTTETEKFEKIYAL